MLPPILSAQNAVLKPNQARLLLAHLRGGNYAHAGNKEAIDPMAQKALSSDPTIFYGPNLDV